MPVFSPIIAPADLYTQMYPEVQAIITRGDATIPAKAIDSAIKETKMYLSKFDLVKLFGDATQNVSATISDEFLNDLVKSIAIWRVLRLANINVDMQLALTWYDQAIATLVRIKKGNMQPEGWPYKDTTGETAPQGDSIYATSNPPKKNFF